MLRYCSQISYKEQTFDKRFQRYESASNAYIRLDMKSNSVKVESLLNGSINNKDWQERFNSFHNLYWKHQNLTTFTHSTNCIV